jgi:hypothetical protein
MPFDTDTASQPARPTISQIREAIRAVLAVYEDEERKHYESNPDPKHVYLSLLTLKRFVGESKESH